MDFRNSAKELYEEETAACSLLNANNDSQLQSIPYRSVGISRRLKRGLEKWRESQANESKTKSNSPYERPKSS